MELLESMHITAASGVDSVMGVVMVVLTMLALVAAAIYLRHLYGYFSTHTYDPPFGKAPSMPEHYEKELREAEAAAELCRRDGSR